MTAELRRGVFLAILGLLIGLGSIAAVFGGLDAWRRARAPATEAAPGAVGALAPEAGKPRGTRDATREATRGPADLPPPADPATPAARTAASDALTFDIVRVEPDGDSVVAGRGAPNTVVELLVDGRPVAKALTDPNGQFAIVPPPLPTGNSEIVLRSTNAEGRETRSKDSVAVAISAQRTGKPLVALIAPDKPTVVLSQPDAPAPPAPKVAAGPPPAPGRDVAGKDVAGKDAAGKDSAGKGTATRDAAAREASAKDRPAKPAPKEAPAPVKVVSVDAQEGGRLFVTSQAAPGATVRLYLNDTLIAPGSAGADGKVTFTIGRGVKPGDYKVRVDQVDPVSGKVRSRAEVPFRVPEPARAAANLMVAKPSGAADQPAAPLDKPSAADKPADAPAGRPAAGPAPALAPRETKPAALTPPPRSAAAPRTDGAGVFVAEVNTAKIIRGDNLWQISRRTYGAGDRYTVIYDANQDQIRNPDLIYPGQIFVLPGKDDKRG